MRLLIMSDLHGNISALDSVLRRVEGMDIDACALLGDIVDYGMHSNEVVLRLRALEYPLLCNLRGNHEQAIINGEYERFSSDRGRVSARHTRSILTEDSMEYILALDPDGRSEFTAGGRRFLAIHGSAKDSFWKALKRDDDLSPYSEYDYVLSGHSHLPHVFDEYYRTDDPEMRNKKRTTFINPGSVGQPRNHNPRAQCAVLDTDTGEVSLIGAEYDIAYEQSAFTDEVDSFYRDRLEKGV